MESACVNIAGLDIPECNVKLALAQERRRRIFAMAMQTLTLTAILADAQNVRGISLAKIAIRYCQEGSAHRTVSAPPRVKVGDAVLKRQQVQTARHVLLTMVAATRANLQCTFSVGWIQIAGHVLSPQPTSCQ